jgi:hypothetical protein
LGATRESPGQFWNNTLESVFNNGYGVVAEPAEAKGIPNRTISKSKLNIPGAKAVKIRYGPYKVPNAKFKDYYGLEGMLTNYPHVNVAKPCAGDCTVIGMTSGLEYPDGKNANIDTGLWLHHGVLILGGPGRTDAVCYDADPSLPHNSVGKTALNSQRIFAFGNERTNIIFPEIGASDIGYKLRPVDDFSLLVELMNENAQDKVVYLTVTYDILEGHPFKDEPAAVYLDARSCGTVRFSTP